MPELLTTYLGTTRFRVQADETRMIMMVDMYVLLGDQCPFAEMAVCVWFPLYCSGMVVV